MRPDASSGRCACRFATTRCGRDATEDDALYLHGFAVRRALAGRGISLAMLTWAAERRREAGKPLLRLDCVAHNARLVRYYDEAGFSRRGTVESRWATLHQRFEKPVTR